MWSGFDPSHVAVTGNRHVPSGEILRVADIPANRSIWLDNTKAIAARVRTIPYIGKASIHRLPPASFTIAVSERVPFAVLRAGGQSAVVDRELRVLSPAAGDELLPAFVADVGTAVWRRAAFVTARGRAPTCATSIRR